MFLSEKPADPCFPLSSFFCPRPTPLNSRLWPSPCWRDLCQREPSGRTGAAGLRSPQNLTLSPPRLAVSAFPGLHPSQRPSGGVVAAEGRFRAKIGGGSVGSAQTER